MTSMLTYDAMLDLVAERSAALRSSIAGGLEARVPGCPDWTGRDLVAHLGEVQRFWAATVAAGPAAGPVRDDQVSERKPTGDLLDWSERSTETLLAALRGAGPGAGTWTWWGEPARADAVARHQVQEAMVHAWDADDAVGRAGALPGEAALDGVAEFLETGLPFVKWERPPATVGLVATDGRGAGWRVVLSAGEGRLETGGEVGDVTGERTGDAVLGGTASDLVLALYRRRGIDSLSVAGDRELAERFLGSCTTD